MYTLEDDQETSARLRKRDFTGASPLPEDEGTGVPGTFGAADATGGPPQASSSLSQQITSSFKRLMTPGKSVSGAGGKRAALAAMIVACVAVFFTALDQTVVV